MFNYRKYFNTRFKHVLKYGGIRYQLTNNELLKFYEELKNAEFEIEGMYLFTIENLKEFVEWRYENYSTMKYVSEILEVPYKYSEAVEKQLNEMAFQYRKYKSILNELAGIIRSVEYEQKQIEKAKKQMEWLKRTDVDELLDRIAWNYSMNRADVVKKSKLNVQKFYIRNKLERDFVRNLV